MYRTTILIVLLSIGFIVGCAEQAEQGAAVADAQTQPANDILAQKAVAGVGKQGQKLNQHSDAQKIISGPAAALINFKQKAVLEIQIPQALQFFKASEGRMPKSHDEFMTKIVEANRLQLPELPEGAVYRFNTEKGELWVYPENEAP
jgi:hypothetical protein